MSSNWRPSSRARGFWLAGYGVLTFLSFPHLVSGTVVDLGTWVAWLGPACLLLGIQGLAPGRAAGLAFIAALAAQSAIQHWIYVVTVTYGHAAPWVGILAPVALATYSALITSVFAAAWAWLLGRLPWSPFIAACLWAALDQSRSVFLTGWPWATLGYTQHDNPALLGLAAWTGVYGLSFAVFLAGGALAQIAMAMSSSRRIPAQAWLALAVVVGLHGLGFLARPSPEADDAARIRVAAIQGDIDQGIKWTPEAVEETVSIYEAQSRLAAAEGAQLIVWPETAIPRAIELDAGLLRRLERLARETSAAFVIGAVGVAVDPHGEPRSRAFYDSAFVVEAEGKFVHRYDKSHLVPFGEYVPFRDLLGGWLGAVARGLAPSDVSEGPGPEAVWIGISGSAPPIPVGVPICYELLFPDLNRRFVADGARLLLAITNDAWYGRTGAPYQFLAMTELRSAETGVWTVRAANTGVSAIIDAGGQVREELPIFERGRLVADVPLRSSGAPMTFYVRYGDVFALACWGIAGASAVAALWRGRRREEEA
ncbi:MAG: apolipoprotein N-acyltransferase [Myxococcota bacterium]